MGITHTRFLIHLKWLNELDYYFFNAHDINDRNDRPNVSVLGQALSGNEGTQLHCPCSGTPWSGNMFFCSQPKSPKSTSFLSVLALWTASGGFHFRNLNLPRYKVGQLWHPRWHIMTSWVSNLRVWRHHDVNYDVTDWVQSVDRGSAKTVPETACDFDILRRLRSFWCSECGPDLMSR